MPRLLSKMDLATMRAEQVRAIESVEALRRRTRPGSKRNVELTSRLETLRRGLRKISQTQPDFIMEE